MNNLIKEVTTKVTREYDPNGKLLKETEEIIEKEYSNPVPELPKYISTELPGTGIMDCATLTPSKLTTKLEGHSIPSAKLYSY